MDTASSGWNDGPLADLSRLLEPAEVYQAAGMLSVQLGVSVAVAEARLRVYAAATGQTVAAAALDIVGRRVRLTTLPVPRSES